MTRLWNAAVAVLFTALAVLVPASPAAAEPPALAGQCTTEEWADPRKWEDCSKRLGGGLADRLQCVKAPTAQSPTSGAAATFTSRPDSSLGAGAGMGRYSLYGTAGYGLSLYDQGCAGAVLHPGAAGSTAFADGAFTAAAMLVGAANGLRDYAYDPSAMYGWANDWVVGTVEGIKVYVFGGLAAVILALVGLRLVLRAANADLRESLHTIGWALGVMLAVLAVAANSLWVLNAADGVAGTGLAVVHQVVGPSPQDIPADRCASPNPDACRDKRTVSDRASDTAVEVVLYRNWLQAMFGDANSPTALKYGPALHAAGTLSWDEADNIRRNPELRDVVLQQKAQRWAAIAEQVKTEDPEAYEHLRGDHGSDRFWTGVFTVVSAVLVVGFDLLCSVVILVFFFAFRVALVLAPLLGTIGVMRPWAGPLVRVVNVSVSAVINIAGYGAAAGFYLMVVDLTSRTDLPNWTQYAVEGIAVTALLWLLRPWRRITADAKGRRHSMLPTKRADETPAEQPPGPKPAKAQDAPRRPEANPPPPKTQPTPPPPKPAHTPPRPTTTAATAATATVVATTATAVRVAAAVTSSRPSSPWALPPGPSNGKALPR